MKLDEPFINRLNSKSLLQGPVVYWMNRDQRVQDNRALIKAQQLALELEKPLLIVFCLADSYLGARSMHYQFMCAGLRKVAASLRLLNIPFVLIKGNPSQQVADFLTGMQPGVVVTDFSPLRLPRHWKEQVAARLSCSMLEVDAHNIVPCRVASDKQEFAAYTLRPKIQRLLPMWLLPLPNINRHPFSVTPHQAAYILERGAPSDEVLSAASSDTWPSGEDAANIQLVDFIENNIQQYDKRNDPNADATSGLSPYLHFGQIYAGRIALAIQDAQKEGDVSHDNAADYLEQLIVRKELSDNFCLYQAGYDQTSGFHPWATKTLDEHRADIRTWHYDQIRLENASTHDPLWNAAQKQMMRTGIMHGYMRMYWAKKILEWSESPEEAMASAIYLNDTCSLDGRDPNGYTGIAWSIGGVHDRAWGERPVFGKIRYMSYDGCKRKFDIAQYIKNNN